jgi:electron transport complex protein RnfG
MKKLKSTLPNMLLSLTGICLVAGAALAGVNEITTAPIAKSKAATLQAAIKVVTPAFDNNPSADQYKGATSEGDSLVIYPAKKGGKLVGVAVESYTKKGFSGEVQVMVGFNTDGTLVNYAVLKHSETPGLGSKMEEWFRQDKNKQSVLGRSLGAGALTVTKDGGEVDAITASTISSRAFLDAINRAYSAYSASKEWDRTTGTTAKETKKGDNK